MTEVMYTLVIVCVSQFPCADAAVSVSGTQSYAECIAKTLHQDDAHRAFCAPYPKAELKP